MLALAAEDGKPGKECPACFTWNNLDRETCWWCNAPFPESPHHEEIGGEG